MVFCQSNLNETASNGLSYSVREGCDKAQVNGRGSVLSMNGRTQEEIAVKELMMPCNGLSTALMEVNEGIGIVSFLKGKKLLITGATGFLAKGKVEKLIFHVRYYIVYRVGSIYMLRKIEDKMFLTMKYISIPLN